MITEMVFAVNQQNILWQRINHLGDKFHSIYRSPVLFVFLQMTEFWVWCLNNVLVCMSVCVVTFFDCPFICLCASRLLWQKIILITDNCIYCILPLVSLEIYLECSNQIRCCWYSYSSEEPPSWRLQSLHYFKFHLLVCKGSVFLPSSPTFFVVLIIGILIKIRRNPNEI